MPRVKKATISELFDTRMESIRERYRQSQEVSPTQGSLLERLRAVAKQKKVM